MADFRYNADYYWRMGCGRYGFGARGVAYNSVIDVLFIEGSGTTAGPITDAEYVDFAKIDSAMATADAAMISAIANATWTLCEAFLNMSLVLRTVQAVINNGNGGAYLPYGPVIDVTEVLNWNDTALTSDQYKIIGVQWKQIEYPADDRLTITYTAGYSALPPGIKIGLLQAFFYLWDNRSVGVDDIGPIATQTLNRYRRV